MMKRKTLFGMEFVADADFDTVAENILHRTDLCADKLPLVATPNVDQVVKMNRPENHAIAQRLAHAAWILPDGQPLVWLSRRIHPGDGFRMRLTGSDLFPVLWKKLQQAGEKVYFVVPDAILGHALQHEYANTVWYAPPYFKLDNPEERDPVLHQITADIASHQPGFVFLGLGFPKQEHIALNCIDHLGERVRTMPVFLLLGASFEFYLGAKKRAPMFYQKLGIEFVHRIISEPRRMVKRYLIDDLAFLPIAWREWRVRNK
jgi:N-acetylglucosaminyldiphosphoundecaprenol N-acetyl-beta-D-mannosaminyltransferase